MQLMKIAVLTGLIASLAACWNGDNDVINLGDVSFGQQMIDLQAALEAGAINQQEYDETRAKFLSLMKGCECDGDSDGEDEAEDSDPS
jgi:hypothetical protein